ncbi:MAG: TolC family protein [Spirochaetia bacterium]
MRNYHKSVFTYFLQNFIFFTALALINLDMILAQAPNVTEIVSADVQEKKQGKGGSEEPESYPPLTIDEPALEMLVLTNNFDYKRAKINYSQSARSLQGVWNDFFPTITGTAQMQYQRNGLLFSAPSSGVTKDWEPSISLTAEVNLTAWVFFNILQVTADYNLGKINFESARRQILDSAKKTFHGLILQKKLLELQESTVQLAQANYRQSVQRYNSGLVQRVDMISTQVELENQRNAYDQQKTKYDNEVLAFKLIVGVPLAQPVILTGEINVDSRFLDVDYLVRQYVDSSPNVRLAQAQVWSNRWQTYYQHFNVISPFVRAGYNLGDPASSLGIGGLGNNGWGDSLSLTVGISVRFDSFLPWSKNGLTLWQLRDQLTLKKEEAKETRIQAHIDIATAANSINNIQNSIRSLRLAYSLSEENLGLIMRGYSSGVRDFVEVQQAIQSRSTALSNYSQGQFDYYTALLNLSYLTNSDITEILEVASVLPAIRP